MEKINVAVIFGGCSPEYGVSLESAHAVISHMDKDRFSPVMVGISRQGHWYHFSGVVDKIASDTWRNDRDCTPALLSPARGENKLMILGQGGIDTVRVDAVFPVLHGENGEDGTIQGLVELAGIPLVGCGTLASALCMDKHRAHRLAEDAGVRTPKGFVLDRDDDMETALARAGELGLPLFVKPLRAGSSFGISKVAGFEELRGAISLAFGYGTQIIIEEGIDGFEVGCAIMGNSELTVGEPDEIELSRGFFDFTEKYTLKTSAIHVPARISAEKAGEVKRAAKKIYRALGCRGFARVDMFLTPRGEIVFNEANTIPGFTSHSRFPNMMKAAGISFEQVISRAIELAIAS